MYELTGFEVVIIKDALEYYKTQLNQLIVENNKDEVPKIRKKIDQIINKIK